MPLSILKKLDCGEYKPSKMTLTLENWSIAYPYGVLEDVFVKVDELWFPIDLFILGIEEDAKIPLILERPFLATGRAVIDAKVML